jgi:hypothetical protein
MAKDDRIQKGILGDIRPARPNREQPTGRTREDEIVDRDLENDEAMQGGSRHDETKHSGSRDVTEGVTGALGTESGGSRNYRQGTGATGGDIGNHPE